ncbi:hypothetical protein CPB85DRAFT_1262904 [Mucidula mucida]|nr:hypothetical protein CPB85DRAFT_1262904 [Mucidula mucida]
MTKRADVTPSRFGSLYCRSSQLGGLPGGDGAGRLHHHKRHPYLRPQIREASKKKEAKEALEKENNEDEDLDGDIPDSWPPAPEVYAKMTSKEKRQLRNKISARNFRVRRKEYINTLELDIAERDRFLIAICSELDSTQSENQALRREIDVSSTLYLADVLGLQENINPGLNASAPQPALANVKPQGFNGFADGNDFTLKYLDAYRMHLWTKMASQHTTSSPAHSHPSLSSSPSPPPIPQPRHSPLPDPRFSPRVHNPSLPYLTGSLTLHGLASNMGVKFFRDSKPTPGPSLGALLSGKQPAKKPFTSSTAGPTPEQALIATLAHQTLFEGLGGHSGMHSLATSRRVLKGKAVVRVVDVDSKLVPKPVEIKKEPTDSVVRWEESMRLFDDQQEIEREWEATLLLLSAYFVKAPAITVALHCIPYLFDNLTILHTTALSTIRACIQSQFGESWHPDTIYNYSVNQGKARDK